MPAGQGVLDPPTIELDHQPTAQLNASPRRPQHQHNVSPTAALDNPSEHTNTNAPEGDMAKLINCQCGRTIRGDTEDEVIQQAEQHIKESHPDLMGSVTREQLIDWIEDD